MSLNAELIGEPFAAVAEERRLYYFRALIKDPERDVSMKVEPFLQFREWLDQLTDEVIVESLPRHYNPTYMNLLSVFSEELTNEEVHSLAIKCIKTKLWNEIEQSFYFSQLLELAKSGRSGPQSATDQSLLRIKGWDLELIRSLLSRGRGLIICSFRLGAIRDLPTDLALLGFPISQIVNQPVYEGLQLALNLLGPCPWETPPVPKSKPKAENIRLLKNLCVEDPRCTVEFVNALKRNEMVMFCIEGNSGSDGPWGETSKSTIDFLGLRIAVKNGAARLAVALRVVWAWVLTISISRGIAALSYSLAEMLSGVKRTVKERREMQRAVRRTGWPFKNGRHILPSFSRLAVNVPLFTLGFVLLVRYFEPEF